MTGKGNVVLIVDDDSDLRQLLATVLRADGLEVDGAANGKQALAVMERRRPDVILLDMRMPVMDGWAFCRELDRKDDRPAIIVMTAAPSPAALPRFTRTGGSASPSSIRPCAPRSGAS